MLSYAQLAKKYGTPLYVYDFDSITASYTTLKDCFEGYKSLICYALKANSNLTLIRHLASLGSGADCVSFHEVRRALLAGIPKYKIIFSGVGKTLKEIEEALKADILFLNVESESELFLVEAVAKELGVEARISLRVNPNVDAKTHPYISTGLSSNKFGIDSKSAFKLYMHAHKSEHLLPVGVHFHIGSQILDSAPLIESALKIKELAKGLLSLGLPLKFFDIGGGYGITYTDEVPFNLHEYIKHIVSIIKPLDLSILTEPGRFLVGNAGVLLTSVLYEKENCGKRFVIVDAAMNDLIRPSIYKAKHKIEVINPTSKETSKCDVVGAICESGDYLAKDIELESCQSGDLLAIKSAGAYGYSMSSNYNSRLRPAEVALKGGKDFLIRHRESFEELIEDELLLLDASKEDTKGGKDG
ncbi:diaminopimelate decarboxylase [Helicobacter sp. 11S02629-2]|uniref:diaminopimelate decarboxylase n=1 Tax=Helicobacter sp. 11S02629-2 TaxID=1476195 RepID=UPI000BA6394A|nr:diaminopimelate decarboxylase [Helicobacter sp. 11S02629-2]PAF45779.1 diaminopimelate decarboxylase [Helicobacter sp. 11S02629-2]